MIDQWTVSDDKRAYHLKRCATGQVHDGAGFLPEDCIASMRDGARAKSLPDQKLMETIGPMTPSTTELQDLAPKQTPLHLIIDARPSCTAGLHHAGATVAKTDLKKSRSRFTGSGTSSSVKEVMGSPWLTRSYMRIRRYMHARAREGEMGSPAQGAPIDRVEWIYIPDSATARLAR